MTELTIDYRPSHDAMAAMDNLFEAFSLTDPAAEKSRMKRIDKVLVGAPQGAVLMALLASISTLIEKPSTQTPADPKHLLYEAGMTYLASRADAIANGRGLS